jgi:hypothetical protein
MKRSPAPIWCLFTWHQESAIAGESRLRAGDVKSFMMFLPWAESRERYEKIKAIRGLRFLSRTQVDFF